MREDTEGPPESVNNCLAEFLDSRREKIYQEWLQQVRFFSPQTDDSFNGSVISRRLPALLEDLTATLRQSCSTRATEEAEGGPSRDSSVDPGDPYPLCHLLDEIKQLRANLLYHLRAFEGLHPDFGMAAMLFVSTVLHRFLDDLMIEAAREFGQADYSRVPLSKAGPREELYESH